MTAGHVLQKKNPGSIATIGLTEQIQPTDLQRFERNNMQFQFSFAVCQVISFVNLQLTGCYTTQSNHWYN